MPPNSYQIRLCTACGLRYPLVENHSFGERCPNCLGITQPVSKHRLNQKPTSSENESQLRLDAVLDNVRSAWNVGAIFRTADGLGVSSLYLCGITPTPDNESVRKTALGAEETVTWKYSRNVLEITKELHNDGHTLVALEQNEYAKPIGMYPVLPRQQVALIVGNEITGVDPQLLDLCDHILYIPMHGKKRSLNVEVAFAIAVYALRSQMV